MSEARKESPKPWRGRHAVILSAESGPKEKLYFFKKDELLTLKLWTDAGGKAVAESAKKKG